MLDRLSKYKDDGRFAGEDSPNAWVCSNPDILTEYDNDPLTQFHFTLSGYQALFKTMEMVYSPKRMESHKTKSTYLVYFRRR